MTPRLCFQIKTRGNFFRQQQASLYSVRNKRKCCAAWVLRAGYAPVICLSISFFTPQSPSDSRRTRSLEYTKRASHVYLCSPFLCLCGQILGVTIHHARCDTISNESSNCCVCRNARRTSCGLWHPLPHAPMLKCFQGRNDKKTVHVRV